jgi:hypothetical protein
MKCQGHFHNSRVNSAGQRISTYLLIHSILKTQHNAIMLRTNRNKINCVQTSMFIYWINPVFSQRQYFSSLSSVLRHCVVLQVGKDVSEEHAAFIFRF